MTRRTQLIVNADDFGLAAAVSRGIALAHAKGIVTSTSLMVHGEDAVGAASLAEVFPRLGVGLHADFSEWAYRDGEWKCLYERIDMNDAAAVESELNRQLHLFEQLMRKRPTHLDSHQHVHQHEPLKSVLSAAAARLDIPLRHVTPGVTYNGSFYGQDGKGAPHPDGITVATLVGILAALPVGITELGCHPSQPVELDSMYVTERVVELATLCDPMVLNAIARSDIDLVSFANWSRA